MRETPQVAQDVLDEIIRRIVEVAKPERIILFGSAGRGSLGPHSDVDLLVIKAGADRLNLTGEVYMNLHGVGVAVDVVVVTPEDVERYRDSHAVVVGRGLKEGQVVDAARAAAAGRARVRSDLGGPAGPPQPRAEATAPAGSAGPLVAVP